MEFGIKSQTYQQFANNMSAIIKAIIDQNKKANAGKVNKETTYHQEHHRRQLNQHAPLQNVR